MTDKTYLHETALSKAERPEITDSTAIYTPENATAGIEQKSRYKSLVCESSANKGSTFTIIMPRDMLSNQEME